MLQYTPGSHSSAELQCQWLVQCSEQISTSGNSAGLVATKKSNSVVCVTQPELLETLASSLGLASSVFPSPFLRGQKDLPGTHFEGGDMNKVMEMSLPCLLEKLK